MRTSGIHTHLGPVLAVAPVLALYHERFNGGGRQGQVEGRGNEGELLKEWIVLVIIEILIKRNNC
jgi:hypothetical protein